MIATTEIWVDGSYHDRTGKMGAGWLVIGSDDSIHENSRRITPEFGKGSLVAEYRAAILALEAINETEKVELFCDNQDVVMDINHAHEGPIVKGKNKPLRDALRLVAANVKITASYASIHQQYIAKAHDLAQSAVFSRSAV